MHQRRRGNFERAPLPPSTAATWPWPRNVLHHGVERSSKLAHHGVPGQETALLGFAAAWHGIAGSGIVVEQVRVLAPGRGSYEATVESAMTRRFPQSLYRRGSEPDPRFSLANERTFLAWVRTSLALMAAGVALEALQLPISPAFRMSAAALFVLLGVLAAIQAWVGWIRTERALRENRALSGPPSGIVIVIGIVAGVVLLALGYLW